MLGGFGGGLLVLEFAPEVTIDIPSRLDTGMTCPGLYLLWCRAILYPERYSSVAEAVHSKWRRLAFVNDIGCDQNWNPESIVIVGIALDITGAVGKEESFLTWRTGKHPFAQSLNSVRAKRYVSNAAFRLNAFELAPTVGLSPNAEFR